LLGERSIDTRFWKLPGVRALALVGSVPTPTTSEPSLVVVSVAVGAPVVALALAAAPTAPEPFEPDGSTPAKLITVMDE
jgi:hypothetical protein